MSDHNPLAMGLNILSAVAGLSSSVVLFKWSLKAGPIQKTLAAGDTVPEDSPLFEAVRIDLMNAKTQLAEVLKLESSYIRLAAALLFASFALSVAAQFF